MTIDDESSIYVGGLPYDATEESLRRVFDIYGAVVAVKVDHFKLFFEINGMTILFGHPAFLNTAEIINDRTVGGKCYGFVTFANPRSAVHAIDDMDGRTIDGRVVRVNEVKTRGGRSNFGRERIGRKFERGIESDRSRGREKDHDHYQKNYRERSHDRDQERERDYDRVRDDNRERDRLVDRNRMHEHDKDMENISRERERSHDHDWERDVDSDTAMQRTSPNIKSGGRGKAQMPELLDRSYSAERGKRNRSSESSDDDHGEVAKQLEISSKKLKELQEEISQMEELAEEKKQHVLKLQDKAKNLEESLTAAKKFTSLRQMQLSKLHKCYQQVKHSNERLKSCEQELQSLVESTMMEMDYPDGLGTRDGILANGS